MRLTGSLVDRLKKGENAPDKHVNPYLEEALEFEDILFTASEVKESFPQKIDRGQDIFLEIGCYLGKTVLELAQNNPDKTVVGLDITYKRAVKTARKIRSHGLDNALSGICDGEMFLNSVPDNSLKGVLIFFPDPWPKARHHKKRIMKQEFVENLQRKLQADGFLWFKTDHEQYHHSTRRLMDHMKWRPSQLHEQPREIMGGPYTTIFENLFQQQGLDTYGHVYRPPSTQN